MRALLFLLIAFPLLGFSAIDSTKCDLPKSLESTRIYFGNGMFNSENARRLGRRAIEGLIGNNSSLGVSLNSSYGNAVNTSEWFGTQLIQVFQQRRESSRRFWFFMKNPSQAPQWVHDELAKSTNGLRERLDNDRDFEIQYRDYIRDLSAGKKVLIVAHSQGNMYANSVIDLIRLNRPEFKDSIAVVSVATPSHVNRHRAGAYYTNNTNDVVINAVRLTQPGTVSPNVEADITATDHEFVTSYVKQFSVRIAQQIRTRIGQLKTPPKDPDCIEPVTIINIEPTINDTSATIYGKVTSGDNVDVWFNFNNGTTAPSCESNSSSYDGLGSYSANDKVGNPKYSLQSGFQYTFRSCAKNELGEISDAGDYSFYTTTPPPVVNTRTAINITKTNATLKGYLVSGNMVDTWFVYGSGSTSPACTLSSADGGFTSTQGGNYSKYISGLSSGTTYRYRFCGRNRENEIASGTSYSFTTQYVTPIVSTRTATNLSDRSAILHGYINQGNMVDEWFVYGSGNITPTCTLSSADGGFTSTQGGNYSKNISNLSSNTLYRYRFCGRNRINQISSGVSYSFRTYSSISVSTLSATDVDHAKATLNGYINQGSRVYTWFVYSKLTEPVCSSAARYFAGTASQGATLSRSFSVTSNSTYHYRYCGRSTQGLLSEGSLLSFTTPPRPPSGSVACGSDIRHEGGQGTYRRTVRMGSNNGQVRIYFVPDFDPDRLTIYQNGSVIHDTGVVSGVYNIYKNYSPGSYPYWEIVVTGGPDPDTLWLVQVYCPT